MDYFYVLVYLASLDVLRFYGAGLDVSLEVRDGYEGFVARVSSSSEDSSEYDICLAEFKAKWFCADDGVFTSPIDD